MAWWPRLFALALWMVCLGPARASAAEISWAFPLSERHVAFIELRTEAEELLGRFQVADDVSWNRFGWRPDQDERRGFVGGRLDPVWLPPGRYYVDLVLPDETLRQALAADEAPRRVTVVVPEGGSGALGWPRDPELGNRGFTWAPRAADGTLALPIGPGEWDVYATGVATLPGRWSSAPSAPPPDAPPGAAPADPNEVRTVPIKLPEGGFPVDNETWLLRLILVPVALLTGGLYLYGLWRSRRLHGARLAAVMSLLLGAGLCYRILSDISHQLPCRFPNNYRDPFDSVFFIASFADSVLGLTDVSRRFSYPEGASWLGTGPAWLGYILPGVLSHLTGAVAANNIAVVLALAALSFSAWALARVVGAGPWTALLAGGGAMLSPLVLQEIDKASFDRLVLFPVPLFFLALTLAAERKGWRWPIIAGICLAAVFYGQVYYGLYLAAACPLLVLYRLVGRDVKGRFLRMAVVGIVAGLLIAPGLLVLKTVTSGSSYDAGNFGLLRGEAPLWPPVTKTEAEAFFQTYDIRLVTDPSLTNLARQPDIPMKTPQDRFLAAANSGLFWEDFLEPTNHLPGDRWYWALAAVSLVFAARRKLALVLMLDVVLLVVYSLGPLLRTREEALMIPLPYYLNLLFVPGFDQLKNLYRYRLMAATLCAVPLALGLEGLFWRLKHGIRRVGLPRFAPVELVAAGAASFYLISGSFQWPAPYAYPRSVVLERLERAPALILPIEATLDDPAAVLEVIDRGLPLVNEMPLEPLRRASGSARWFEHLGMLNHLASLSGARRPNRFVPLTDLEGDLRWFEDQGVRYVIVFRRLFKGVELVGQTAAFLDTHFERVGQDGAVIVWDTTRPVVGDGRVGM